MRLCRQFFILVLIVMLNFYGPLFVNAQSISEGKGTLEAELINKAEKGNAEDQWILGDFYLAMYRDNPSKGLYWYQKAASQGYVKAIDSLASEYFTKKDYEKAEYWSMQADKHGSSGSQYSLGQLYYFEKKDFKKGLYWLNLAAEHAGETGPKMALWMIYNDGIGQDKNSEKAMFWYNRAVKEIGEAKLDFMIGCRYDNEMWFSKDYHKAAYWYKKSADLGDSNSQGMLGRMYWYGEGVPQDFVTAYMWLNISASNTEEPWAKIDRDLRDKLSQQMTPTQIEEGQRRAREWKPMPEHAQSTAQHMKKPNR